VLLLGSEALCVPPPRLGELGEFNEFDAEALPPFALVLLHEGFNRPGDTMNAAARFVDEAFAPPTGPFVAIALLVGLPALTVDGFEPFEDDSKEPPLVGF